MLTALLAVLPAVVLTALPAVAPSALQAVASTALPTVPEAVIPHLPEVEVSAPIAAEALVLAVAAPVAVAAEDYKPFSLCRLLHRGIFALC